jgi:deazaflavin-dependent oxidoreductase (nitroreductase family)
MATASGARPGGDTELGFAVRSVVVAWFVLLFLRAPIVIRLLGPVLERAIRAGLPAGPNVLLTVRGRTSRRPRTVPVALLELPTGRFVQSPYGEVQWVHNLRAAGEAEVTAAGRTREVRAVELAPETAAPILRDAVADNRRSLLLRRLLGPVDRPPVAILHFFRLRVDATLEDYVAEARRHPVFELYPVEAIAGA